jgi:hypothetical protein
MDLSHVTWRTSSHSGSQTNCVQVGVWRKASYSGSQASCVEVGAAGRAVAVRDSKDPDGPKLAFAPHAWQAFTRRLKGERPGPA